MRKSLFGLGLLAVALMMLARPAAAEFFGCDDQHSASRSRSSYSAPRVTSSRASFTHEFSAQSNRPHITIFPRQASPGRSATRHCRSWLAKEYRISGTVIVPRQQCWWE